MAIFIFQIRQVTLTDRFPSTAKFSGPAILLLLWLLAVAAPAQLWAQGGLGNEGGSDFAGTLFGDEQTLFPRNGRINMLVVGLNPFGLTESAAEQIGLILQKNLSNSGHFNIVGPRVMNARFEKSRPDLVDCREIACGVEAGKRLEAHSVLVGNIRMEGEKFILTIRLIDTLNNITDYEEEIHFKDETMDEDLFRLSNNISSNSILTGRVLNTSIRGIVISLGKKHGIEIGDFLVVFKLEVPVNNLAGEKIDTQKKKIAIVKILNVNENSSEAILAHSVEAPQVSHYAQTYLDPVRQIELVEDTRREIDTGIRLENKIRPLELAPVLLADSERKKWRSRLFQADLDRRFWMTVGLVSGVTTLVLFDRYENNSTNRTRTMAAVGVTTFATWRFLQARNRMNDLRVEGRAKGYLTSFNLHLGADPGGMELGVSFNF